MTLRPCLTCGEPSPATRCPEHTVVTTSPPEQRGYDRRWRNLSRRARAAQPFCTDCGATTDLQADHSPTAWARRAAGKVIRLEDIAVVCAPCNLKRGAARGRNFSGADKVAGQR